jgi:RNA processing factor Prp31
LKPSWYNHLRKVKEDKAMTLETAITIAHSFDEELTVVLGDEFTYIYVESTVIFGTEIYPEEQKLFCDHIKKTYGLDIDQKEDYELFSLLHEIGHHFTMDDLEEEEAENELLMRNLIHCIDDVTTANETYFNLPSEMLANDWAFDHFEAVKGRL